MKFHFIRLYCFFFLIFFHFFISCEKGIDAVENQVNISEYKIENITYFWAENDKIDTLNISLDTLEFKNLSNMIKNIKYVDTTSKLLKSSIFELDDNSKKLPNDLKLAAFQVLIPEILFSDGTFGFYSEKFPISDILINKRYINNTTSSLDLILPPTSKFIVTKSINQYNISCSFQLNIRNMTNCEKISLRGKWKGNLRFNNENYNVKEIKI